MLMFILIIYKNVNFGKYYEILMKFEEERLNYLHFPFFF